ncbi:MAG: hypothetical protein HY907_12060 [Deltaproteobacteria bacterium]|nr:hypothetical protein [Deltaproteobacteria bacterium]
MRIALCIPGVVLGFVTVASAAEPPPGSCPGEGAEGVLAALERTDAGEGAAAELDLAACYRTLEQQVPEAAALGRALDAGLTDAVATAVRARLDEIGWPPPPRQEEGLAAMVAAEESGAPDDEAPSEQPDPLWAYTLTGIAAAALVGGTAAGFVALDADADGSDALTPGIAAAVCAGVGIAAGIAALFLWPDSDEVRPTPGPGDVGIGLAITF